MIAFPHALAGRSFIAEIARLKMSPRAEFKRASRAEAKRRKLPPGSRPSWKRGVWA